MRRRTFLAAGVGVALAGCTGPATGGDDDGGTTPTASTTPATSPGTTPATDTPAGSDGGETATATPEDTEHPALSGLADQPVLGDREAAAGLIVAFEDPSCDLCRRFEQNTYPKLVSKLVDPGKVAFVYRVYPVVYPWGEPASQALESTFAADESAFWALKDHYYAEQFSFDGDNVLSKTETFLADETDVDAAAVVDDARNQRHGAAVEADLEAGRAAGAGSQTPKFFLFRDGEFRTKVSGPQDYQVFATALGF